MCSLNELIPRSSACVLAVGQWRVIRVLGKRWLVSVLWVVAGMVVSLVDDLEC